MKFVSFTTSIILFIVLFFYWLVEVFSVCFACLFC